MRSTRSPAIALLTAALLFGSGAAHAQDASGSTGAALAAGGLGLAAGATLGVVGSIVPCSQTLPGPRCVRAAALAGAGYGLVFGAAVGAQDSDAAADAWRNAGIGAAAGLAVGAALTPFVQRWAWYDAVALGGVGAAVGSSPVGAGIGFAAGGVAGLVLWRAVPGFGPANAAGVALAGLVIGGLAGWFAQAVDAADAHGGRPPMTLGLSLAF